MTRIFLSYARVDEGEPFDPERSFVARLHGDLTAHGLDVWFDRVSMPSRGMELTDEVRRASAERDPQVAVIKCLAKAM